MGQIFVSLESDGKTVAEPYDEENGNVPIDAIPITDIEFDMMKNEEYSFGDFEIVGGVLQLKASANDNLKTRIIENMGDARTLRALVEILIDEINLLRAEVPGMQPRTLAQFKTAMKNKLT